MAIDEHSEATGSRLLSRLAKKLALFTGGVLAVAMPSIAQPAIAPLPVVSNGQQFAPAPAKWGRPLPPKLTLKQTRLGVRIVARHASHSSHSSHSSHASHASGGF